MSRSPGTNAEFLRFLVGGVVNTAFSYSLYLLLNVFIFYQLAYLLAYVTGVVFSYWLNSRWVFKTEMAWRTLFSYPLVYLFQYGFGALLLHVMVAVLGLSEQWSPLVVIVVSLPVTFLMSRFILKG